MVDLFLPNREMLRHFCLIGPEGAICVVTRISLDALEKYYPYPIIQMLDEGTAALPQPFPAPIARSALVAMQDPFADTPVAHGNAQYNQDLWIFDRRELPDGWLWLEIEQQQYNEIFLHPFAKEWDRTSHRPRLRPGFRYLNETGDDERRGRTTSPHLGHVRLCRIAYGGVPLFALRAGSIKKERDFSDLEFSHHLKHRKEGLTRDEKARMRHRRQLHGIKENQHAVNR